MREVERVQSAGECGEGIGGSVEEGGGREERREDDFVEVLKTSAIKAMP